MLAILTLFVGWLVWSAVIYSRGQSPAKQILGMRVVRLDSGRAARFGTMFLREFLAKSIIGFVAVVTVVGLLLDLWLIWDRDRQELWDKLVGTIVVDDPTGLTYSAE